MAGLLDTFTIARRGLTVQQGNINTSSHNISNIDTEGYSRQRAVSETTRPFGECPDLIQLELDKLELVPK